MIDTPEIVWVNLVSRTSRLTGLCTSDRAPHYVQEKYRRADLPRPEDVSRIEELEAALADGSFYKETAIDKMLARAEAAEAALERDRSIIAETINAVHSEIAGREWLPTGRGSYEWDDDRYRAEFADALAAIRGPIESLRSIARDWTNCPTDPEKIKQARADIPRPEDAARIAELEAALRYTRDEIKLYLDEEAGILPLQDAISTIDTALKGGEVTHERRKTAVRRACRKLLLR